MSKLQIQRVWIEQRTDIEFGTVMLEKSGDLNRKAAYLRGDWQYIGIIAKCELWNPQTEVTQVIHSGGLWSIESDSVPEYLGEVALDELAGLKSELLALGLGPRAIAFAFSKVEKEPVAR